MNLEVQHKSIKNSDLDIPFLLQPSEYKIKECDWFFSSKDQNYELSNMAGQMPIVFKGVKYNSSECLYQASKYHPDTICAPESADAAILNVRERIVSTKNAMGSKMTQKCAVKAGLVRSDWMDPELQVAIHSMLWVLELKFIQNEKFRDALMDTILPIVEKSRKDNFWGCLHVGPLKDKFVGSNVLGKLLTIIRDEKYDRLMNKQVTYPEGFII